MLSNCFSYKGGLLREHQKGENPPKKPKFELNLGSAKKKYVLNSSYIQGHISNNLPKKSAQLVDN